MTKMRVSRHARRVATALAALLLAHPAIAQEDHSSLTRAKFRHNCLMCHNRAAPEGIAPEILAGLSFVPGLKPRDAMPNLVCWRRCERCWPPEPAPAK
jgi:hypothetical protein